GAAGVATVWAETFGSLLLWRVLQGIGYTAVVPLTIALFGDFLTGKQQVSAQGYRVVAMSAAEFSLPIVASLLITRVAAWQQAFWVFLLPLAIGVWAFWALPDDEPRARQERTQPKGYARQIRQSIADST